MTVSLEKASKSIEEEFTERDPLNEKIENEEPHNKRNFKESCIHVLKNITVEPTMFLYIVPSILIILTSQNLSLEKACRVNLNFSDEICDSLRVQTIEGQNQYERDVQRLITKAMAWKTYITATIPCILALFIGSWCDKTGYRKIFIVYPIVGQILVCLNGIIQTYFFHQLRLEYLVFSEAIIEGISGYWCVCFLSVFAYISAITTDNERTFRMGLISFSLTVGFPIGMIFSGILIKNWGYYGGYGVAGSLNILNCLYNTILLKDPEQTAEQKKPSGWKLVQWRKSAVLETSGGDFVSATFSFIKLVALTTALHQMAAAVISVLEVTSGKNSLITAKGFCHVIRCFFDLSNIKDTVGVILKTGANHRKTRIIIMLAVTCILFGPMHGELSILYISTRYRFSWDELKFSIFQTYNFICHTIGTIFSITYFSKKLQWHDSVLGIISTLSKIAASVVYCFAPNERIFYIAPLVDILNGTSLLAMRSIISKIVDSDELGKINSIFALSENLMPLIYIPLYTRVYAASMEVLPGAPFLMGSAMTIPAVIVFIYLFYEHRKQVCKNKTQHTVKEN